MPTPEARRAREHRMQVLQTATVVIVMIAMLLTGVVWMMTARTNNEQDRRDCQRLAAVSKALQGRTQVYREKAMPEQDLWVQLRREILKLGIPADSPAIESIDAYLQAQKDYVKHLAENPYPSAVPGECD